MKDGMTIEYLKYRAALNFEVDYSKGPSMAKFVELMNTKCDRDAIC